MRGVGVRAKGVGRMVNGEYERRVWGPMNKTKVLSPYLPFATSPSRSFPVFVLSLCLPSDLFLLTKSTKASSSSSSSLWDVSFTVRILLLFLCFPPLSVPG